MSKYYKVIFLSPKSNRNCNRSQINIENVIIMDNRKDYFKKISTDPFLKRMGKKIRYVNHINIKKQRIII